MTIPFDLWGRRGYPHAEVAGESHYSPAIRRIFGKDFKPDGCETDVTAALIPDSTNRHDRNAVGVLIGGELVGYLPRVDAATTGADDPTCLQTVWAPAPARWTAT